ncbi:hypothetical protein ACLEXY_08360 [Enterobacter ludwigii]|uniref:hypothetical protein n=1 Tax=Enterobacter TaxID=547 RepID=UPI000358E939|nr:MULTISPECIES: hypothetical protein [Enterobacter]EKS6741464.1 hypothetical protein [Enterobacter ludwigii]ELP5688018.1 hypothetical protein [Enterobacter ludwigii]EPR33917.1 hypothetical protein EcloH_2348 [Enterobacter ludwigii]KLR44477.1 hypothetical protein ABR23_14785 [Enterobacter ludwigii]MDR0163037.1 hypothetical protein [Enterobacter ludwigii]
METSDLEKHYHDTNAKTLALWETRDGIGAVREPFYATQKLALATGFQPEMTASLDMLFRELRALTRHDSLVDLQPPSGFHFTFVPITLPLYDENAPLPAKTHQLIDAWTPFAGLGITVRELRLVALPNQLLLAGIPDTLALRQRQAFCERLLTTDWQAALRLRHGNTPLPAPFWHTTLLRYQADCLPESLRAFFRERRMQRYGEVCGELKLNVVNYNWTLCRAVTSSMLTR